MPRASSPCPSRTEHPKNTGAQTPEITPLTGLRGIAACWVMVAHYLGTTRGPDWLKSFIDHGYIPVDIFLILSGFVLAFTYQAYFRDAVAIGGVARFLAYRLARIYPLYAVTTLICLVQLLCGVDVWGNAEVGSCFSWWPCLSWR